MLHIFLSAPYYCMYVQPSSDLIPSKIKNNLKFFLYFQDAIGAIDGSHIPVAPPAQLQGQYWNQKSYLSQNVLFTCDFDLKFTYMLSGWEGLATDAHVYDHATSKLLHIPQGKYLLANISYPLTPQLLVPFLGIHYHLAEWGCANIQYMIYPSQLFFT